MAKIAQGFLRRLALAQAAAGDQFVHHVGSANGQFGQKLGPVEQPEEQFKNGRVAVPQLEQNQTRAIGGDEIVQARHDAVRVREGFRFET